MVVFSGIGLYRLNSKQATFTTSIVPPEEVNKILMFQFPVRYGQQMIAAPHGGPIQRKYPINIR